ncbi:glycosyltransferase family 2 protein [Jannaschia ovalis]|uniref:Glycosyltransferase n=1 Tax=Jannaschia ovalis TaxID=3038773 RepID=A0ABY8L7K1_9RHOB|nr:glycosyltransferase [Jannaschia sp. GRR-S6-38]WGH77271.1 glycosyltransferase [Jannaschia sp. GRR-S6-38]
MTSPSRTSGAAGPRAAVIIPHFNDPDRLARCLAALMGDLPDCVEVLVVDNGSHSDPGAWLRRDFPEVRLLCETRPGAGPARNRGAAETDAELLLFLDADCVPGPGWVATALCAAREADLVGGDVEIFDETPPPRSGAEAFETTFAFDMRRYLDEVGFLGSGNLVTRREVHAALGGFRPAVSEDKDYSHRARAAGFTLGYVAEMRVGHPSRADWPALRAKWRRLTDEAWALHRAEGRGRLAWVGRALLMPVSVLAHLPRVLRARTLTPGERWRAAGTLLRIRMARMLWMLRQALAP